MSSVVKFANQATRYLPVISKEAYQLVQKEGFAAEKRKSRLMQVVEKALNKVTYESLEKAMQKRNESPAGVWKDIKPGAVFMEEGDDVMSVAAIEAYRKNLEELSHKKLTPAIQRSLNTMHAVDAIRSEGQAKELMEKWVHPVNTDPLNRQK